VKDVAENMNLAELLIVSKCIVGDVALDDAVVANGTNVPGVTISVREAEGTKCPRCWTISEQADPETGLCPRCARVVAALN
jgi:Zn finger protein HypA/HybF involved in hydrogenase expression